MSKTHSVTKLKLLSSHPEVGNVHTFVFETGGITWIPGQAQGYTLPEIGSSEEENQRWFTIASSPDEEVIHISTRVSQSKFKQALAAMKPGDTIDAHDLEGHFTWVEESDEPVLLVAGGIGITPFRSILKSRQFKGSRLNATLLHFNRDTDVPFQGELEDMSAQNPDFKIETLVGEDLTAEVIINWIPDLAEPVVYLSGPEPMVERVGGELRERGVRVIQDRFPGYDEKTY